MAPLSHVVECLDRRPNLPMVPELGTRHRGRVGITGVTDVLHAFLTYLEEHPATQKLAGVFTEVLTELGELVPARDEAVA
jgi:hypothetical protein